MCHKLPREVLKYTGDVGTWELKELLAARHAAPRSEAVEFRRIQRNPKGFPDRLELLDKMK